MKISKAALCVSALALLGAGISVVPAQASSSLTTAEVAQFRANMADAGIESVTQDVLVAKLQAQQPLDSMLGVEPVRTFTEERSTTTRTVNVYADGSRSWTESEVASPSSEGSSARSAITRCAASGSWRVNCRVDISDLVSSAWFVIDYKAAAPSQVRDFRGAGCQILGGSCNVNGKIGRATQSSAGPAWAYLNYNVTTWTWIGSSGQFGIRISNGSVATY